MAVRFRNLAGEPLHSTSRPIRRPARSQNPPRILNPDARTSGIPLMIPRPEAKRVVPPEQSVAHRQRLAPASFPAQPGIFCRTGLKKRL